MKVNDQTQSQSMLLIDYATHQSDSQTIRQHLQGLDNAGNTNECIYHPGPPAQILPSGLRRTNMVVVNESPQQADRELRTELRAKALHKNLTRPEICKEHNFCLAQVPQSPTEQEPSSLRNNDKNTTSWMQSCQEASQTQRAAALTNLPNSIMPHVSNENAVSRAITVSFHMGKQSSSADKPKQDMRPASYDEISNLRKEDSFATNLSGILDHASQENDGHGDHRQFARAMREMSIEPDNSLALISPCRKPLIQSKSQLNPWEKVIVTMEEYDNWRAQMYGLTINNFPKVQPPNMPADIFQELKKKYVAPTKIRVKKKDSQEGMKVESRYMNWQKEQARQQFLQVQKDGTEKTQAKERRKSAQQSANYNAFVKSGTDTISAALQDSLSHSGFTRMTVMRHDQDQSQRHLKPSDFTVAVFNKNSKVDNLVSYTEPTEEQLAKRQAQQLQQAHAEKARVEQLRLERNRKTKVALSQKQKIHALKLYSVLGGIVSRKEIEKTAFKAHGLGAKVELGSQDQKKFWGMPATQSEGIRIVKENAYSNLRLAATKSHSRVGIQQTQYQSQDAYAEAPSTVGKAHSRINLRENAGPSLRSSWQVNQSVKRPSTSMTAFGGSQKHPSKFSCNSSQALNRKYETTNSVQISNQSSNVQKKRIYKVWGVSSQKILNKRVVQTKPISTIDKFELDQDGEDDKTRAATSVSNFGRPPTSKQKHKVVNARSAAAKIILRSLGNKQSAEHIRMRSNSIGATDSRIRQSPAMRRSNENSLAFMGQYLQHDVEISKSNQMQNSLMRARASKDTLHSTEQLNVGQQHSMEQCDLSTPFDSIEPLTITATKRGGSEYGLAHRSTPVQEHVESKLTSEMVADLIPTQAASRRRIQSKNAYHTAQCDPQSVSKRDLGVHFQPENNDHSQAVYQTLLPESRDGSSLVQQNSTEWVQSDEQPKDDTSSQQETLNHVLEHTAKHKNADMLKSLVTKKGEKAKVQQKVAETNLTKMQPCSTLFRNIQAELTKVKIENQEQDMERQQKLAQFFSLDKVNFETKEKQDRKLLSAIIGGKHDTALVRQKIGKSTKNKPMLKNSNGGTNCLEQMAGEQRSNIGTRAQLTSFSNSASPFMRPTVNASAKNKSKSGSTGAQSTQDQELKLMLDGEQQMQADIEPVQMLTEESLENAELYANDLEFNLADMLKDESEDEEPQVNYEINHHQSSSITLDESHKYRKEIKDNFYIASELSPEAKIKQVNNIRDADFWLQKGISMTGQNQLSTAIQCYKQTLLLNEGHYVAMFNLAVCYERRDKYSSALKWFKRASQIKPDMHYTFIGAAINFFKLGQFQDAEKFVRASIEQVKKLKIEQFGSLNHTEKEDIKPFKRDKSKTFQALINDYQYILTLCLRKLHKFEEASRLYLSNAQFYRYVDRYDMVLSIFGLLLLPMQSSRRVLADEIETIHDNLQFFKNLKDPIKRPLLGTYYSQNRWHMGLAKHAAEELRQRSFFKRFRNEDIVKFLPKMEVKQYEPDKVIFPDFDVCIIVSGLVESKFHVFGDRIPKPLAKYGEGDILGFISGDSGTSAHVETWSISRSHVEVIWMKRSDFFMLWQIQQRDQKKMLCQIVRMQKCFQNCNELTIHRIAFEMLVKKHYKAGQKILRTAKRSTINEHHKSSMVVQTNYIQRNVLKHLTEFQDKMLGGRLEIRHSNMWQLMLRKIAGEARESIAQALLHCWSNRLKNSQQKSLKVPITDMLKSPSGSIIDITKLKSMSSLVNHETAIGEDDFTHSSELESNVVKDMQSRTSKRRHLEGDGLFIIETGMCKIELSSQDGKEKIVACIARNDSFGASSILKLQTLDYLGDIVAGGEIQRFNSKQDKEWFNKHERDVVCWYLSTEALRRIPEFELKTARQTIQQQNYPFVKIAARKYSQSIVEQQKKIAELQTY